MKIVLSFFLVLLTILTAGYFILHTKSKPQQITTTRTSSQEQVLSTHQTDSQISSGTTPKFLLHLPSGYTIHIFASNLGNPRDIQFTPDGTLLASNPSGNDVYALPDKNHDGVADSEKVIISGENHVHGLAFYQNKLYVADVDKVVRYNWNENTQTATKDKVLFTLPENNDHNSRTIVFNSQGQMFVSVGSTCNICSESPEKGGSVWVSDANGNNPHIFATGLRNAAFLQINPTTGDLWGTEMGRDYLGDTTPPDEINIIQQGNNYGWPYCYGDNVHDHNFDAINAHSCSNTISPIYEIPAHSAPLGFTFINSTQFPSDWQGDLLVAYHGSWNSSTPIGYKVVHLKVSENTITGSEDFITGFAPSATTNNPTTNNAQGRPVDLTFDTSGNLYLSDDKAGSVYIIQKNK